MVGVLVFKTLKDFARKTAKLKLGSQSSCSLRATGPNGEEMWLGGLASECHHQSLSSTACVYCRHLPGVPSCAPDLGLFLSHVMGIKCLMGWGCWGVVAVMVELDTVPGVVLLSPTSIHLEALLRNI